MKKIAVILLVLTMSATIFVTGCGIQKVESGNQAIEKAQTMKMADKQEKYLLGQAEMFIKARQFQDAIEVLKFILTDVNKASDRARELLNTAQNALSVQAQMVKPDQAN